ncbi:MAG: hypothetical protein ACKORA_05765 [Solirubrobacterales bacterium]
MFGAIREGFPTCFHFCVGTPQGSFLGASPELLVSSEVRTVAAVGLGIGVGNHPDPCVEVGLPTPEEGAPQGNAEQAVP